MAEETHDGFVAAVDLPFAPLFAPAVPDFLPPKNAFVRVCVRVHTVREEVWQRAFILWLRELVNGAAILVRHGNKHQSSDIAP